MLVKKFASKNFRPTKYIQEKIWGPGSTHEKIFWAHESTMTRWHETHEIHDGTRPTEFSTLHKKLSVKVFEDKFVDLKNAMQ